MLRVIHLLHFFELAGEEMKQFHFLMSYSVQTELIDTKMTSWRTMNNKKTHLLPLEKPGIYSLYK